SRAKHKKQLRRRRTQQPVIEIQKRAGDHKASSQITLRSTSCHCVDVSPISRVTRSICTDFTLLRSTENAASQAFTIAFCWSVSWPGSFRKRCDVLPITSPLSRGSTRCRSSLSLSVMAIISNATDSLVRTELNKCSDVKGHASTRNRHVTIMRPTAPLVTVRATQPFFSVTQKGYRFRPAKVAVNTEVIACEGCPQMPDSLHNTGRGIYHAR